MPPHFEIDSSNNLTQQANSDGYTLNPVCDLLPDFEEILALNISVIRHVPKACRNKWARVLASTCDFVLQNPSSEHSYRLLLMLPRCCLRMPPRTGRKKVKNTTVYFSNLFDRWLAGDYLELWKDCERAQTNRHHKQCSDKTQQELNVSRCIALAQEGNIGKACKALLSTGLAQTTDEVCAEMSEKHPVGPELDLPFLESSECLQVQADTVLSCVNSFPIASAPGRSYLRPEHLKEALKCPAISNGQDLLDKLTRLINLLISGKPPVSFAEYFCGARLIALKKEKGGVRPIAVGEILRRLAAKCVSLSVVPLASELLFPSQIGVGLRNSCETAVHTVREILHKFGHRNDLVLAKVDLTNAFNMVDRSIFLEVVKEKFPDIFNWVNFCYGKPSILDFNGFTISSACGVQQGDPLGPLLFSLALTVITEKIERETNLLLNLWYFDDGNLIGNPVEVGKAIQIISSAGPSAGFHINFSKCELFWPTDQDLTAFPSEMKRLPSDGVEILGAFLGNENYIRTNVQHKLDKVKLALTKLESINNCQIEFAILRSCLSASKANYIMRTTDPKATGPCFTSFDLSIREALEGVLSKSLTDVQWNQACLPCKQGGLGIRLSATYQIPAFVASRVETMNNCSVLLRHSVNIRDSPSFNQSFDLLKSEFPEISEDTLFSVDRHLQRKLSDFVSLKLHSYLLQQLDPLGQANLLSFTLPAATDLLNAPPIPALGLALESSEFRIALCRQLRVPVFNESFRCPVCKSSMLDTYGDHALVCSTSGDVIARHNAVRDFLYNIAKLAGLSPKLEPSRLLTDSSHRPGDIYVPNWSTGKPLALDVTIASPLQSSLLPAAAETAGVAAERAEERKTVAFRNLASDSSILFAPFALESSGGLGNSARKIFKELSTRYADRHFSDRTTSTTQLKQRLSVLVHKHNANMIIARHQGIPDRSSTLCHMNEPDTSVSIKRKVSTMPTLAPENGLVPDCAKKHRQSHSLPVLNQPSSQPSQAQPAQTQIHYIQRDKVQPIQCLPTPLQIHLGQPAQGQTIQGQSGSTQDIHNQMDLAQSDQGQFAHLNEHHSQWDQVHPNQVQPAQKQILYSQMDQVPPIQFLPTQLQTHQSQLAQGQPRSSQDFQNQTDQAQPDQERSADLNNHHFQFPLVHPSKVQQTQNQIHYSQLDQISTIQCLPTQWQIHLSQPAQGQPAQGEPGGTQDLHNQMDAALPDQERSGQSNNHPSQWAQVHTCQNQPAQKLIHYSQMDQIQPIHCLPTQLQIHPSQSAQGQPKVFDLNQLNLAQTDL